MECCELCVYVDMMVNELTFQIYIMRLVRLLYTPILTLVNIHTHSLGALFYLILLPLHLLPNHFPSLSGHSDPLPTPPTTQDKLAFTVYLLSAIGCLSLSAWFHTVQCHTRSVCDAAHRGDYVSRVCGESLIGRWA
jgi:predicted membrane channel-forming protein YqfA (hemolysin III family)